METDDDYVEIDGDDCAETGDDDCAKIDDDECAVDDAAFGYEAIVNAADEEETDDAQHAFADAMESTADDDVDVGDGAAENVIAALDHDAAVIKKMYIMLDPFQMETFYFYYFRLLLNINVYTKQKQQVVFIQ